MSKLLQYFAVFSCILFFVVPGVSVAAESIEVFTSDIAINSDGTFVVTETIVYDFGSTARHGIFRTIPLEHNQKASVWYKRRYIDISFESVSIDGQVVPYSEDLSAREVTLKIGDPEKTIAGVHEYILKYLVVGGLVYIDTEDPEFYWNVTGSDWPADIQSVITTIHGPKGSFGSTQYCYSGHEETAIPCEAAPGQDSVIFKTGLLQQGMEVTVAQSLSTEAIGESIVKRVPPYFSIVPLLGVLMLFVLYMGLRFRIRNDTHESIIPQYNPYPNLLPMYTGLVLDGKLDPRDITAGIMYLAQQGFLKIKKTDRKVLFLFEVDDYELTLMRPWDETPTTFHKQILSLLFSKKEVGEIVSLGSLKKNTSKQRTNYRTMQSLKSSIRTDLVSRGFYENAFSLRKNYVWGVVLGLLFLGYLTYQLADKVGLLFYGIMALIVGIIFAGLVGRRRTVKGYEARYHSMGFKQFLSVTDTERFAFHNAPDKDPQSFMEYLPYAVAFGVEKQWAEVFKDIPMQNPDWYQSQTGASFVAADFSRDMGAFSNSLVSSSGTSPSSGGGSTGGGSGGGGGGSW